MKNHLLIIDPQNDFCSKDGSLSVPGAFEDMMRLGSLLLKHSDKIDKVTVTLDTHQYKDIAHGVSWVDEKGQHPGAFTVITKEDVLDKKWTSTIMTEKEALQYLSQLERQDKYRLCIWPPHCLLGSTGHAVNPSVLLGLLEWENQHPKSSVQYVQKGINRFTEHYSAICAEVVDPFDASTGLNEELLEDLEESNCVLVAGEASSHCVRSTMNDYMKFRARKNKVIILSDMMSPVPGFEKEQEAFFQEMKKAGALVVTSKELAESWEK